ncbi:MAG: hypothetical protein QMC93_03545 [Patescibacteria group bacterium]|nr:hypothetical protein [Patescibacteria group bacterium]
MLIPFQGKLRNIPVLLLVLILGIFIISSKTQALVAPEVYCIELNLAKNNFEPSEEIQGTVSLWNYENFIVSDLRFYFQLLGKEINGVATEMIDEKIGKEIFSLSAGEKVTKSFTYSLPSNLPKGNFKFRVQLATSRGEEMGWIDKVIEIGGEGKFLTLDNYWIVKDSQDLSPGGGVYYQPGEIPEIRFDVTNNSGFTIIAFSKVITYKRNVGQFLNEIEKEGLILQPAAKQTIKTVLPQLDKPETYLSEVRLYDSNTKEPVSNSIYFRWIISGEEDAEILFVNLDKDSYHVGEEAKVQIQFTGPAHFEMEGGEGIIEVKLLNQEEKLVGEEKKAIKLEVGQVTINVPVKENTDNPKVVAQIVKEGKTLDQYEFQTRPLEEETKEPEKVSFFEKISFFEKNKKLIISLIIIILILGVIIYYLKTKK